MKTIRDFLCNVPPIAVAFGIILTIVFGVEIYLVGILEFFFVVGEALLYCLGLGGGALLLYKAVGWAQSYCKRG